MGWTMSMGTASATFHVEAYVNVDRECFFGLRPEHDIALVDTFEIKASGDQEAAGFMWTIGNKMSCDIHGKEWPSDVRSLSVGDVLRVKLGPCHQYPEGHISVLGCASFGWDDLGDRLANRVVPIEGSWATSRPALQ